jgi:predicted DNA-binding transcriptional regulator AlpA
MDRPPLAKAPEVAAFFGVPLSTLYQWRYRGVGPAGFRVGRHIRYEWSEVERWLAEQRDS